MTGRCGKKAWPSSPRPLCLMFKRKRRDPRSCLPQLQANSVSGWNRFSLRAPCASSLHHRVKGLDRTCTCVCVEVKEPTCDLRKKHVCRSALRVSAQPPKCLEEQAEPSFGGCIKYGFLEHDPHCDCHSSASALCSRRCKGRDGEEGSDSCLQVDQAQAGAAFVCCALRSQTAPRAAWGEKQLYCSPQQNSDVLYGL